MKAWSSLPKRIGKKYLPMDPDRRRRLLWAAALKPGDVIFVCDGYNDLIVSLTPKFSPIALHRGDPFAPCTHNTRGKILVDIEVNTASSTYPHSAVHCCSTADPKLPPPCQSTLTIRTNTSGP